MHATGTYSPHACDHRQTYSIENQLLQFIQYLTTDHTGAIYGDHSGQIAVQYHARRMWMLTEMAKVFQSEFTISDRTAQMCFQMLVHLLLDDGFASEESPKWKVQEVCYILIKTLIKQYGTALQGVLDSFIVDKMVVRFTTPNLKEREQLVYIVHATYEEFVQLRVTIRKSIGDRFLLANQEQRGISELLFLMGCFVGGFRVPLRDEHMEFFTHVVLPLYNVGMNDTDPLDACALQFIEKDSKLAERVVEYLINNWPESHDESRKPCSQQFFKSLARIIPYLPNTDNQFNSMHFLIFAHLSKCLRIPQLASAAVSLLCDSNMAPIMNSNPLASHHLLYDPLYRIIIGTTDAQLAQKCSALLAQLPSRQNGPGVEKAHTIKYFSFTPTLVNSLN